MNNTINNEINILETENQNINTSLELFEIVKQNAEEYCNYIKKYKECTWAYFDKISKLTYNIKKENTILNNNLNITSIFSILNKIPELVKLQIEGIKKFVESLDLTIKPLENVLKNEINSLEEPKRLFEENKKKYQKNMGKYRKLMDAFSISEKKIIKYYLSKKRQKDFLEEKNNMILSLRDSKIIEKEFYESTNGEENFHFIFQEDSLKSIEQIKSHIRIILENLNSCILFFLCIFKDCYYPCVNFVQNETENINKQNINTTNLINDNMLIKIFNLEEIPLEKYKIKLFNNPDINKLSYSIDITTQVTSRISNFTNIINFFIKDDDYTDKLILMKKYKKSTKKNQKISYEEKKKLFELVQKKENAEIFLTRLNKIRSFGNFEYPKKIFDDILKIMLIILDEIEINKDCFLFQFSIILSQTFYYMENEQKQYIYKFIKHHKIFHSEENWRKMIEFIIHEKSEKFDELEYKIQNMNEDKEKRKNKIMEIIFAQLIAIEHNMVDFDFDLDSTEKIMIEYINKYELNEFHKELIMAMINEKRK